MTYAEGQSMKVLILTTEIRRLNGAERLSVELAEALNHEPGIEAEMACMYASDMPGMQESDQALRSRGIPRIHYLGLAVRPSAWSVVQAVARLRRLLKKEAYDIVETSLSGPAILASWATWGLQTRHVAGVHNAYSRTRFDRPKHKLWRFSVRGSRCAKFYAISEYVRSHWMAYTDSPADKTQTVYNGIPNDCYEAAPQRDLVREEFAIPQEARIALFVGRLSMRKGIDTLLAALGPILEGMNLYIVYVGEWYPSEGLFAGEAELQDTMQREICSKGWDDRVRFAGRRNDVPRLMASSDILVHPARLEGFGLILAEAMAAGLPVVASNVEGIPEVLAGTDSIMVPPDDPAALRDAVLATLNRGPEERARAIEKGRKRAEAFRMKHRVDAMIRLFEDVLNRRS